MAIHWYKSALIITTIIHGTACLSADNDSSMTGPYGGKRKFTAIEDGSPLPSAKRQRVITPYDEKERNILIEKIAKRLINLEEVKTYNMDDLFPHHNYTSFTGIELIAYQRLLDINEQPFPSLFCTEVNKRATQGECEAQFTLGYMYYHGCGVKQDYAQAFELCQLAALQNNSLAQFNLGNMYYLGHGVKQDYAQAFEWFHMAAKQKHPKAQCNLGIMYYHGQSVKQDYVKALEWLHLAADQKDPYVQYLIGHMYYYGQGVKQDYLKALEWLHMAAQQKQPEAQLKLGNMYYHGQSVKQDYAQALELFQLAAEQKYPEAQFNLGNMYYLGHGVEKDYAKALEWYQLAALQKHLHAQFNLGNMYHLGKGVKQDYSMAFHWFAMAAQQGQERAKLELKKHFKMKKEAIFSPTLSNDEIAEGEELERNLMHLKDHYTFHLAFSRGGMRDNFGSLPLLTSTSQTVLELIDKYLIIIKDQMKSPGYFLDCLALENPQHNATQLLFEIPSEVASKEFVSLFSSSLIKEIDQGHLTLTISHFADMIEKTHLFQGQEYHTPDTVKSSLSTLKLFNPEAHSLIWGMTENYLSVNDDLKRQKEWERLTRYLKKLNEDLQNHKAFASQINERLFSLLVQTASYRNALCKQKFPFLFD